MPGPGCIWANDCYLGIDETWVYIDTVPWFLHIMKKINRKNFQNGNDFVKK